MEIVSAVNPKPKIVPRVYVEGSQSAFFQTIGSSQQSFKIAVSLVS